MSRKSLLLHVCSVQLFATTLHCLSKCERPRFASPHPMHCLSVRAHSKVLNKFSISKAPLTTRWELSPPNGPSAVSSSLRVRALVDARDTPIFALPMVCWTFARVNEGLAVCVPKPHSVAKQSRSFRVAAQVCFALYKPGWFCTTKFCS